MTKNIGRYAIIREIGRGAMGIVYEAHDPQLNRKVALKLLSISPGLQGADRRQAVERFTREARAAGALVHPNIAQVYDVGEDQGRSYIVMELCEGTTLRNVLSFEGAMKPQDLSRLAEQLLSALETAHHAGVIHRDVKPENIVIGRDNVLKLTDFGIAKVAGENTMTAAGQALGSPAYMSPEQILGKPVDARTDIFSAGVVLYECMTGRKPFDGTSLAAVSHAISYEEPAPAPGASPFWISVLSRALAKDPALRFQSATEMLAALRTGVIGTSGGHAVAAPVGQVHQPMAQTQLGMPGAVPQQAQPQQFPPQQQQYPPQQQTWGPPGYQPQPRAMRGGAPIPSESPLSTAAMVLGCLGFFFCPLLLGGAGIVLSAVALSKNEPNGGVALAVALCTTIAGAVFGAVVGSL